MNAVAPLIPCIVSGGSGTRLWPVSRESMPKPFMRLADDQSLLQKTFLRIAGLPDVARLLGSEGDAGKDLQLPRDWVVQMVRQVG
ncbi:sugar phosphate nucleotidyltransferase, partial [Klebsiella pneumoniae]